ncbi:MAG TPA: aminotransferase class V-fold PLP-dependent enzyme [Candidatus Acidoferrales bacterium]|nr:aminotransferase class V-fold PLP-dependent enzyme [Candidatus Acidoferrales bacterium]
MTAPVASQNSHTENLAPLDINWVRAQFPSLRQTVNGHSAAFLDAPAGTQVPQRVIDAFRDYFEQSNANTCGAFATSRRTDAMIAAARAAMADFFHCDADEVFFGPNMTTLTFALARGVGRDLAPGDEIVVTTLDHDANVAPWRALEERGIVIRQVDIREPECTLDMDDLRRKITSRTKLVAVGYASNAVGTINPVAEIIRLAHAAGALAFIDAVHYAPHGSIDVRALDCDFLACSPYKFFGPHMGCLFGKREQLLRFRPYKVRPAPEMLPDRWETGTQLHEGLAGVIAAIDYLADLGRHLAPESSKDRRAALECAYRAVLQPADMQCKGTAFYPEQGRRAAVPYSAANSGVSTPEVPQSSNTRRAALESAYRAMRQHEMTLATRLICGLLEVPGLRFYGISDPARFAERVGTVGVRLGNLTPLECAKFLGDRGIFTWDGNYYALNLTERLGVEKTGGLLRIGVVHYNIAGEVDRLLAALRDLAASR